jgi:translocation and assembly module TamB
MKLRRWLRISVLSLVFLGCLPLSAWWLINDEAGTRWLLQRVVALMGQQMSVTAIHGKLREGIELENVEFHDDSQAIHLKHLFMRWQLADLYSGLMQIQELKLDGLTVLLLKSDEKSEFDPQAKIELPVQLAVDNFVLTDLQIEQEETRYQVDKLQFSAATVGNQLHLHSLSVQGQGLTATAKGKTTLGEGFAFAINIAWQFTHPEHGQWRGVMKAQGDSSACTFDNQLLAPFVLQQQGRVENLRTEPTFTTRGNWQNMRWPLTGKWVQIASKAGDFKVSGSAQAYQLQLQAQLAQEKLPPTQVQFSGNGTQQTLHIDRLNVQSKIGQLQVSGEVGWQDAPQFDLVATGWHFNPAIVMPDMNADLNFKTSLKGQMVAEKLQLAVDIDHLTGKFRNYPVLAQGQLNLLDNQLAIKNMTLLSGVNKLSVSGELGEKNAALDITLAAPQLHSLWATLGGQLNATAHLQGELTHPSVQLKMAGKQLHFENHVVKQFDMTVNYAADNLKPSQLHLTAAGLSSGKNQITQLSVTAHGLKQQHSIAAQVNSPQGEVKLALNGALRANDWQAQLRELMVKQPLAGRWFITHPVSLAVGKRSTGVDVALGETCFTQARAVVCAQGSYPANGNFQGAFHAVLPSELGEKYFPPNVKFAGQLNAAGSVQKTAAGLNGRYQFSLSKNSHLSVLVDKQLTPIAINHLSLSGVLQGTRVSNDIDVLFADKNYLRGQLRLDTAGTQAMSGQLTAAIMDFSPLQPFILPLTELKGNLTAAVAIAGTLTKPALTGNVALNHTSVTVEPAGLHLQEMNVKLSALASSPEQVRIDGGLKSGTGHLAILGKVQLNPGLGYPTEIQLVGDAFEVAKLPQVQAAISPQLKFVYAKNSGAISGKLTIAKAQVQLEELPPNAAVPSDDEQIVGQVQATAAAIPAPQIGVDIAIDLGKQTHLSGLGLEADLIGSLKLTKKAEQLAMFGKVDLHKARYKSYGQDLTVRRGRFVFNGAPDNPLLDVEAIRLSKSKKVTAILKLSGNLQTPKTQILSEPALPESDALAYLVTGSALNQLTKGEGNMLASAALSYGAGQVAWLAAKFGIDEFELQEGENMKDSLLAVGHYLTPDFYVGARVGLFSAQTLLLLKYKITEALSISTQAGESQRVYVNYEFSHE